jgi:hypothetical protein
VVWLRWFVCCGVCALLSCSGGKGLFSAVLFVSFLFMPESPRWLVAQRGDMDAARKELAKLRYGT